MSMEATGELLRQMNAARERASHMPGWLTRSSYVPVPDKAEDVDSEIITEARRLFDKQRSEPHGEMMPLWEKTSIPIREAWIAVARQRLAAIERGRAVAMTTVGIPDAYETAARALPTFERALTFEQKCNRKRTNGPTPCLCCLGECVGCLGESFWGAAKAKVTSTTKNYWKRFCFWRSRINGRKAISAMGRGESWLVGRYVVRAKRWELAARRAAVAMLTAIFLCAAVPIADARGFWPFSAVHERGAYGLVAPLAAKVNEIIQACGSRLTPHGGVRHTFVAGTRRLSLHNFGQAADLAGNPRCILYHLIGWPGGASVDYARVQHYHISWGGSEWGKRFEHRHVGKRHVHHHVGKHHRKHGKRR